MITIYRAVNIADAHLIRQMLEAENIPAFIQGEYLQGAVGELPANTEITVQVADGNAAAARAIVDAWESAEPEPDLAEPTTASVSVQQPRGMSIFTTITLLLGAALLGAAAMWTVQNRPSQGPAIDHDGDGHVDERLFMAGDRIARIDQDRNRNEIADQRFHYDANGLLEKIESDDDFNDHFERIDTLRKNQMAESNFDFDRDDRRDARVEYMLGVIYREEWFDSKGNVVKRVQYEDGVPKTGEFDSDGDGRLDTARRYDRRGEIIASEPLPVK
jgi:Putative prokaryotic signal transducing protein